MLCYTFTFCASYYRHLQDDHQMRFNSSSQDRFFLAQATKKRAAVRRKKAPSARKASAGTKSAGRVASRRATATRRSTASAGKKSIAATRKPTPAGTRAAAAAALAHTQRLSHMGRLLREVGGIVCGFAALIVLLALITFDPQDPGWSHTGSGQEIQNSVGRVGAWFSDVTLSLFGFMAYLIPLVLGISGWLLFRDQRRSTSAYRPYIFVRIIGVSLMLISASGLADLHFSVPDGALPNSTFGGGILGTAVAWRLVSFLHHLGTTLLLLAVFFSSLTLAFGTSWLQLIESIGGAVLGFFDRIRDGFASVSESHREQARIRAADRAREQHLQALYAQEEMEEERPRRRRRVRRGDLESELDSDAEAYPESHPVAEPAAGRGRSRVRKRLPAESAAAAMTSRCASMGRTGRAPARGRTTQHPAAKGTTADRAQPGRRQRLGHANSEGRVYPRRVPPSVSTGTSLGSVEAAREGASANRPPPTRTQRTKRKKTQGTVCSPDGKRMPLSKKRGKYSRGGATAAQGDATENLPG